MFSMLLDIRVVRWTLFALLVGSVSGARHGDLRAWLFCVLGAGLLWWRPAVAIWWSVADAAAWYRDRIG